jgi:hypothetical protein
MDGAVVAVESVLNGDGGRFVFSKTLHSFFLFPLKFKEFFWLIVREQQGDCTNQF